jgi:hypothetical protein
VERRPLFRNRFVDVAIGARRDEAQNGILVGYFLTSFVLFLFVDEAALWKLVHQGWDKLLNVELCGIN